MIGRMKSTKLQSKIPTEGLIASYPLVNDFMDATGNYNGQVDTGTVDFSNGISAYFDGSSSFQIDPSPYFGQGDVTICGWIKNIGTDNVWVISQRLDPQNMDMAFYNSDMYFSLFNTDGSEYIAYTDIPQNTHDDYYFFTFVVSGNDIKAYDTAILRQTTTFSGTRVDTGAKTRVGIMGWQDGGWLNGWLGRVKYYNRALTEEEITDIYNEEIRYYS